MRSGFKIAAAGLAVVWGCAACALSPVDVPASGATVPTEAVAQDALTAREASSGRAAVVGAGIEVASSDVHISPLDASQSPAHAAINAAVQGVQYRDGVYRASARGWQGSVPVTVTVSRGKIESVVIGQNAEAVAMADKAQAVVVPQIIEGQSTQDIDLATGATHTSQAIVEAAGLALELALVG